MCNYSGQLIAWMDDELTAHESAAVDRHLLSCGECQSRVKAYENISHLLTAYTHAASTEAPPRRTQPHWLPALAAAALVATVLFIIHNASNKQTPVAVRTVAVTPLPAVETARVRSPVEIRGSRIKATTSQKPRHAHSGTADDGSAATFADSSIQITIPADAMFPPGAIPEGVTFVANVSMASDGYVQNLRLQQ